MGTPVTGFEEEPISFSTDDLPVTITKTVLPGMDAVAYWVESASTCGPKRPAGYYQTFADAFADKQGIEYVVAMDGANGEGMTSYYTVFVLPNALRYTSLQTLKEDFFACDAGVYNPLLFNDRWIVFTITSGGAFDPGRVQMEEAIMKSIQIR